jgi:hypothetical protein
MYKFKVGDLVRFTKEYLPSETVYPQYASNLPRKIYKVDPDFVYLSKEDYPEQGWFHRRFEPVRTFMDKYIERMKNV